MLKKILCTVLSVILLLMGTVCAEAASENNFSLDKVGEYFTLMNGCSRVALKNYGDKDVVDAIVYCGLDLSSPKIMFYLSMFYITNNIDTQKLTADPEYCTQIITKLDSYLSERGIANSKANEFVKKYQGEIYQNKLSFPTVGAYTFKTEKQVAEKMLDEGYTDFVIVGTGFMLRQGDANADGKIDNKDVKYIQSINAELVKPEKAEEKKFTEFACDLCGDGKININDVTALQQKLTV